MTLTTKHQRLTALRPLSLESVASFAAAWDVRMVAPTDQFTEVSKMIALGKGGQREIKDFMLTRYACYLIAQNGDPTKDEIVFCQTYFALQALDCGSLLPLSATQPAASRRGQQAGSRKAAAGCAQSKFAPPQLTH